MGVIFYLSSQTRSESAHTSGSLIRAGLEFLFPAYSSARIDSLTESLQFIVRKSAHFIAYAVLGLLSFLSVITYRIKLAGKMPIIIAVPVLYSLSDEYHQSFVKGRGPQLRDVGIDSLGALFAIAVCLMIYLLMQRKKETSQKKLKKKDYILLTASLQQELDAQKQYTSRLARENDSLKAGTDELQRKLKFLQFSLQDARKKQSASLPAEPEPTPVQEPEPDNRTVDRVLSAEEESDLMLPELMPETGVTAEPQPALEIASAVKAEAGALPEKQPDNPAQKPKPESRVIPDRRKESQAPAPLPFSTDRSPKAKKSFSENKELTDASKLIGKIVLSSARYCNDLSLAPVKQNSKELIHLILGRTEVAKSAILEILSSDAPQDVKKTAMEKEVTDAEEYFLSIKAQ